VVDVLTVEANIIISNWLRTLWDSDWEVVKKSGRDEPMWVVIYMCMEATVGISLYNYLYLKLGKMICLCYLCLSSTKSENKRLEQVLPRTGVGGRWP
jgi:hypothetical protein